MSDASEKKEAAKPLTREEGAAALQAYVHRMRVNQRPVGMHMVEFSFLDDTNSEAEGNAIRAALKPFGLKGGWVIQGPSNGVVDGPAPGTKVIDGGPKNFSAPVGELDMQALAKAVNFPGSSAYIKAEVSQ